MENGLQSASTFETCDDAVEDEYRDFLLRARQRGWTDDSLLCGVDKTYGTATVAALFGKTKEWVYWGHKPNPKGVIPFSTKTGQPIVPIRSGKPVRSLYTLGMIRAIAHSCFRRGTMNQEELLAILAKILIAEYGRDAFEE